MKAIPDLDFAAKQIKPAQNQNQNQNQSQSPSSTNATPEHRPNKPQHKLSSKDGGSRRGSDELTVARYRTEKPSKSPPPPPPRRSFPSSPGLTTRSGEMILPGKTMKVTSNIQECIWHTEDVACVYLCMQICSTCCFWKRNTQTVRGIRGTHYITFIWVQGLKNVRHLIKATCVCGCSHGWYFLYHSSCSYGDKSPDGHRWIWERRRKILLVLCVNFPCVYF